MTQRDLDAFAWLSDMKAITEPDLGVLLGRLAGSDAVSASAVRRMIVRWTTAGYAFSRRVLADQPRYVFLLAAGAALVEKGTWRDTGSMWTAQHCADIARLRLWLEGHTDGAPLTTLRGLKVGEWQSERRWRQEMASRLGRLPNGTHAPDAVLSTPSGKRVAVEVERTVKDRVRLDRVMDQLLVPGGYDGVLYAVTNTAVAARVQAAVDRARGRNLTVPVDIMNMPGSAQ